MSGADFTNVSTATITVDGTVYSPNLVNKTLGALFVTSPVTGVKGGTETILTINNVKNPSTVGTVQLYAGSQFANVTFTPGAVNRLQVNAPATLTAHAVDSVQVVAYDVYNNLTNVAQNVYLNGNLLDSSVSATGYILPYSNDVAGTYDFKATTQGVASSPSDSASISVVPAAVTTYQPMLTNVSNPGTLDESETGTVLITAYDAYGNKNTTSSVVYFAYTGDTNVKSVKFFDALGGPIPAAPTGISFTTAGTFKVVAQSKPGTNGVFAINITDNKGTPVSSISGIGITKKFNQKVSVDLNPTMIINERSKITISLKDLSGANDFVAPANQVINLSSSNSGFFFANVAEDNQPAIFTATVPEGKSDITFWYQPKYIGQHVLTFNTLNAANVTSTVYAVYAAGKSFIASSVNTNYQGVSDKGLGDTPTPNKITFTINDQYGYNQLAQTARDLTLTIPAEVKAYTDAACTTSITDNKLTIPVGSASASVYLTSQKAEYFLIKAEYTDITSTSTYVGFNPITPVKATIYYNEDRTYHKKEQIALKLDVRDKYDNYVYYNETYNTELTAKVALGTNTTGKLYYYVGGQERLITQTKVNSYFYFKTDVAGPATITAELPAPLTVAPVTINVSDDEFDVSFYSDSNNNFYTVNNYAYVNPEWRVPLTAEFFGAPADYSVSYKAYKVVNGVDVLIDAKYFFDGVTSGVNTTSTLHNYDTIWFEVPAYNEGTLIKVIATPVGLPAVTTTLMVKHHSNWERGLNRGWNILSTPFQLSAVGQYMTNIIAKPEYVQIAYKYVNGQYLQVTGDPTSLVVAPLEAYYVKLSGDTEANFVGFEAPTAPPVKALNAGWNFVSPALDINTSRGGGEYRFDTVKKTFFSVLDNATLFASPVFNPDQFSLTVAGDLTNHDVFAGYGYWIYMNEAGNLTGFSTTPVEQLLGY